MKPTATNNGLAEPITAPGPGVEHQRVQVRGLCKEFTTKRVSTTALSGVSLDIAPGEMAVLLGPSGCGKTTLLRSIAGLERPQGGEIQIDGSVVYDGERRFWVPPERRHLSMVFQSYALWPHMTAFDNIAYPLRNRRVPKAEIKQRVYDVMDVVGLGGHGSRLPSQLSGGQQQRVALARALVAEVGLVLFDEPLSNVDAKVREQVRRELVALQRDFGFAGLYVTHDQVEAGAIADKLIVMDHGRIAQVGTPQVLYDEPNTRYVGNFMGSANEVTGRMTPRGSQRAEVDTSIGVISGVLGDATVDREAVALWRPENCHIAESAPAGQPNCWPVNVAHRLFMGSYMELIVEFDVGGERHELLVRTPRHTRIREGDNRWLYVNEDDVRVLAAS